MSKLLTVGEIRHQCARQGGDTLVVLVSQDPEVRALLERLTIVHACPDTTDAAGKWASTFKIEVGVSSAEPAFKVER